MVLIFRNWQSVNILVAVVGCVCFWIVLAPYSPLNYELRSSELRNRDLILSRGPLHQYPVKAQLPGAGDPFTETAEIASRTGVLLLIYGPGPQQPYERLELYTEKLNFDHLDGLFWGVLALFTDIRPTTITFYLRNYLFYLSSLLIFSILLAVYYRRSVLVPVCFLPVSLLIYLPPIQTLITQEYLNMASVSYTIVFMASYLLLIAMTFQRPSKLVLTRLVIIIVLYSCMLAFLAKIHSANESLVWIIAILGITILFYRFRPTWKIVGGVVIIFVCGHLFFNAGVSYLRTHRDAVANLQHIPKPTILKHTTFPEVYRGIGIFSETHNSLGISIGDHWSENARLVQQKAKELGVEISKQELTQIGGISRTEYLFFRMWISYISKYPLEYINSRIQAHAWVLSKLSARHYPLLSDMEKVLWCMLAVSSWFIIAYVIWLLLAHHKPLEIPVILLITHAVAIIPGIVFHPFRGFYATVPLILCVVSFMILSYLHSAKIPFFSQFYNRNP